MFNNTIMYKMYTKLKIIGLILLSLSILLSSGCEPGGYLIIENKTNLDLTLYIAHVREDGTTDRLTRQGTIPPNIKKEFSVTFVGENWVNRVVIQDPEHNNLFQQDYKMADLDKVDWKITIPGEQ